MIVVTDTRNILINQLQDGDEVYACEFKETHDKEDKRYIQKPVLGQIKCANTESKCEDYRKRYETYGTDRQNKGNYFVPYRKDGKGLAWSKAVTIYAREYFETEEAAIDYYNRQIKESIDWHWNKIKELRKEYIGKGFALEEN